MRLLFFLMGEKFEVKHTQIQKTKERKKNKAHFNRGKKRANKSERSEGHF